MKTIILPCLLSLFFTVLIGCDQSTPDSNAQEVVSEPSGKTDSRSIIEEPVSDTATVLASRQWDLPANAQDSWEQAKEATYQDTLKFNEIQASVVVRLITLSKDTSNFIVKHVDVRVLQPHRNYVLSANIFDQANMGNRQAFNTYVTLNLQASLKPRRLSTLKLEGKMIAAYAKTGAIEEI